MSSPTTGARRAFNLADALILAAFTAFGMACCIPDFRRLRLFAELATPGDRAIMWKLVCRALTLILFSWTAAFFPLRLRKPRPRMTRLWRRLGGSACLFVVVSGFILFAVRLALWVAWRMVPDETLAAEGIERPAASLLAELSATVATDLNDFAGAGILATWTILAATRSLRWRSDWVDVFGCLLALGWILLLWDSAAITLLCSP